MSIFIDLGLVLGHHDVSVYGRRLAPASHWSKGLAPSFLFACSMLWLSGWIRLWCYRTLGRMFTYEVTLRDGHVLVTWGPYAYVRHPSYTGVVFGVLGTLLLHFGPGSWFYDGGWLETRGGLAYAGFWVGMEAYVLMCIMTRVPKEDGLLKSQFKEEWTAWAVKVPYRVVPGLY